MICAIVKADAYGLGAVPIARTLVATGVDMLAVYSVDQAIALLEAGIDAPLLVLMPTLKFPKHTRLLEAMKRRRMHFSVDSSDAMHTVRRFAAQTETTANVHLNLDTGMSRAGMDDATFDLVLSHCRSLDHISLQGIYTHFASPIVDIDFLRQQLRRFDDMLARNANAIPDDVIIHTAGTFASMRERDTHRDMVRIGLGLYGYGPELLPDVVQLDKLDSLRPIVRWSSRIIHVQDVPKHRTVGYQRTHKLDRDARLGIVPVGHGDGYPVALSNRGCVELSGNRIAPLIGVVNMDQLIVDLTDFPDIELNDEVTLFSDRVDSPCHPSKLAEQAGTNIYEMLCRLSKRLPRIYSTGASATSSQAKIRESSSKL